MKPVTFISINIGLMLCPRDFEMFMYNGIDEVVRLKGSATLHIDEELKVLCPDGKKAPKLVVKIDVQTVYFHCAKAIMMRQTLAGRPSCRKKYTPLAWTNYENATE